MFVLRVETLAFGANRVEVEGLGLRQDPAGTARDTAATVSL